MNVSYLYSFGDEDLATCERADSLRSFAVHLDIPYARCPLQLRCPSAHFFRFLSLPFASFRSSHHWLNVLLIKRVADSQIFSEMFARDVRGSGGSWSRRGQLLYSSERVLCLLV